MARDGDLEAIYDIPRDETLYKRSNLLTNITVCLRFEETLKQISDIAFDAVDEDKSGGLDASELHTLMHEVSIGLGVTPPTQEDLESILGQLDDNFDGVIDKGEFLDLVKLVVMRIMESELELQEKINE